MPCTGSLTSRSAKMPRATARIMARPTSPCLTPPRPRPRTQRHIKGFALDQTEAGGLERCVSSQSSPTVSKRVGQTRLPWARRRVSIALACRAFGVSETCYRYSPKLRDENAQIADLLVGLTASQKNLGVWAMFSAPAQCPGSFVEPQKGLPDLLRAGTEPSHQAPQAVEAGQTRCVGRAGGPQSDLVHALPGRRLPSNAVRGLHG